MRIAIALAILAALGAPARASDDVGVVVTGEGSMQPQLAAQITDWLSRHGRVVVPSPLPPEAITALIDCFVIEDQACARGVIDKRSKSAGVVYARIDTKNNASTGARDVTLTAYWFVKGRAPVVQKQACERCTDQSLQAAADELMKTLVGGDVGHVKLKSSPPGARIMIDGQPIGVAPLDWDLPAGKHVIQMDKPGLRPASRDVMIANEASELVVMTLDPLDDRGGQPSTLLPYSVIAAGGAALAIGIVLIAIDEDPSGKRPTYRDSAPAGTGLAITGGLVAGAGAYWLYRTHKATSTPVAAFTTDTAYIGWLGQF